MSGKVSEAVTLDTLDPMNNNLIYKENPTFHRAVICSLPCVHLKNLYFGEGMLIFW